MLAPGNIDEVVQRLLGPYHAVDRADDDAFAAIAAIVSKTAGLMAEEVEEAQLLHRNARLDLDAMAECATEASMKARTPMLVFKPLTDVFKQDGHQ